jgi:transposase
MIYKLLKRIQELEAENAELKGAREKNSQNSSKPPSSDGYNQPRKPKSQRGKSEKKAGGQPNHQGSTLKFSDKPDTIKEYQPHQCKCCNKTLSGEPVIQIDQLQQIDIPEVKPFIKEHRIFGAICPNCGTFTAAEIPKGLHGPISYGPNLQSFALYSINAQFLPYDRSAQFISDWLNIPISSGTLFNFQERGARLLGQISEEIQEKLIASKVVHFDETGLRVNKKLHWVHSASNADFCSYQVSLKRGSEGMVEHGILPRFNGISVHDHWKSYYEFNCQHSLCNEHQVRELTYIGEDLNEHWAIRMRKLLLEMCHAVNEAIRSGNTKLSDAEYADFERRFELYCRQAERYHSRLRPLKKSGIRGKAKQRPGKNMVDRFRHYHQETLAFLYDFDIPFTNNMAEQVIRMLKVKQKISGCFRSIEGAKMFCDFRGYLSTAQKQGVKLIHAIRLVTTGKSVTLDELLKLA